MASSSTSPAVHPVDERLPTGQSLTLGIQHVFVMYAGAIAVPLILGAAMGLSKDQVAFLISADLVFMRRRDLDPDARLVDFRHPPAGDQWTARSPPSVRWSPSAPTPR